MGDDGKKEKDSRSRKWLLTINNPDDHEITNEFIENALQGMASFRYACYSHEIGLNDHTYHIHIFVAFDNAVRFSTIKNIFNCAHIDMCKGTIKQNRDYVFKAGKWADTEKEDTRIEGKQFEIGVVPIEVGQGHRSDLEEIEELIDRGYTPEQIFELSIAYRLREKEIRAHYMAKRKKDVPVFRDVRVIWHVGESGTGKSYTMVDLMQQYPDDVYLLNDYEGGGLDLYQGERILFMDEFRGQIKFNALLGMLDGYRAQVHCRYANVYALWDTVHITSVLPPEMAYNRMVQDNRDIDVVGQLLRRISEIVYHYKKDGNYGTYAVAGDKYRDYDRLRSDAGFDGFRRINAKWADIGKDKKIKGE